MRVLLGDALSKKLSGPGRYALTGVAAALCLVAPSAWSLGLGRLSVQSALGESLRAEIDITSLTPEEASNLSARIAAPEAYRTAGVDYNAVLPATNVSLQRRADGHPYLRLTSDRAVQEPFVEVILEINWASGRLVRDYTLLFDPPTMARATPVAPTTAPAIAAAPPAPPAPMVTTPAPSTASPPPPPQVAEAPPARPPAERRAARPPAEPPAIATRPAKPPEATASAAPGDVGADTYKVRSGDTLSHVASRTQRTGVSLDQMLVALFRSNPQAFIDSNMNRLKAGVVLTVPSADAAKGVPPAEARQVIQAQSADFGAYRQRLAGAVPAAKTEGNARQASGQVQANVDDRKRTAAPTPDKLTLSKAGAASAPEDKISRDRERKDAAARVAELSKNVAELNNLRGATAAAAGASAAAAKPGPAPTQVAAATPPAPAAAPAPKVAPPVVAAVPVPSPVPASAPSPAPAAKPAASVPAASIVTMGSASAPTPVAAATPAPATASSPTPIAAAPKPAPAKPPVVAKAPAPPPPEEPGFFASMFQDNPLLLGAGGIALLLLAGFGVYRYTRKPKVDSGETSFLESRLQPDSFFGASGGQRIDTRDAGGASSSMSYSLSQLDAIGDVDPVAEADVYLAYGRDLQAEEILKEAMRANPERMAIRTKLLEVYAKRRDTKGFELLATQLFALTRGEGEDWAKAQELGAQIDPENPLFQPGGAPPVVAQGEGGQIVEVLGASTMPQSVLPGAAQQFGASVSGPIPLDGGIDLDLNSPDIGTPTAPGALESTQAFATPQIQVPPVSAPPPAHHVSDDAMSLDFTLPDLPPAAPAPRPAAPSFDPGSMSLDLDLPDLTPSAPAPLASAPAPLASAPAASGFGDSDLPAIDDAGADPLARKLELAEEFRQIGDTDGARDLLEEVVAKASGALKSRAQSMLDSLG
ncbi:MAG: hypothetical protein JSR59_18290 [Proteobacteria bacterium]|nr:hypothetical protein [Pseudomonadota bacterium]